MLPLVTVERLVLSKHACMPEGLATHHPFEMMVAIRGLSHHCSSSSLQVAVEGFIHRIRGVTIHFTLNLDDFVVIHVGGEASSEFWARIGVHSLDFAIRFGIICVDVILVSICRVSHRFDLGSHAVEAPASRFCTFIL